MAGINVKLLRRILVGFVRRKSPRLGCARQFSAFQEVLTLHLSRNLRPRPSDPRNVHACIMPYKASNPESEAPRQLRRGADRHSHQVIDMYTG